MAVNVGGAFVDSFCNCIIHFVRETKWLSVMFCVFFETYNNLDSSGRGVVLQVLKKSFIYR